MCFGGGGVQQVNNTPSTSVDDAYKSVVQTSENPDTTGDKSATSDKVAGTATQATPLRTQNTGITFASRG